MNILSIVFVYDVIIEEFDFKVVKGILQVVDLIVFYLE